MNLNLQSAPIGVTQLRTLRDLPGPRGLPFLGNALQLDTQRIHLILEDWVNDYGPIYKIGVGPRPAVVIADPELNNQILRARPDTYRRGGTIKPTFKEMGTHGVFSAEGEEWKAQRRLAMQALSSKYLRNFFPTMIRVIERLLRRWQAAAATGATVDVQKDLMRLTVDVTTNLTFGYDMNTLENDGDVIQEHLEKIFPMLGKRVTAPFPYWRYFKLPADRVLDRALVEIHKTIQTFIQEARQRLAAQPELKTQPTNFLQAMLAFEENDEETGQPIRFTDEEIAGNVFTMLLAGEDTTANTLSWMLYYLCLYPDVQRKLQLEADAVLGADALLYDLQNADKLHYSDAVTNETMRLRPVAPLYGLQTNDDVEIAGYQIPKGTLLYLLSRPGAMQKENFAQPQIFHPERWLTAASSCPFHNAQAQGAHNRSIHIPFGNGPRICPGRSLALLEIKATMAMICRNFHVTFVGDPKQVREVFAFAMMPQGLTMRFTARNPPQS